MRSNEAVLGLDVGGAHLKFSDLAGRCRSLSFPLWQRPDELAAALARELARYPRAERFAVTMTGELADCFSDAAEGVRHIVEHTMQAVQAERPSNHCVGFYTVDGTFVTATEALREPNPLAASNWHALAAVVASLVDRPTLLIDIGSTTTDLTALNARRVASTSRTDFDRLQSRELVYLGIGRTPLCALIDALPVDGKEVPVMNELFATTDDCALLAGIAAEVPDDRETADGRPRTVDAARGRMAKMVGLDRRRFSLRQAQVAAEACLAAMAARIAAAAASVAPAAHSWIIGGHGAPLLQHRHPPTVSLGLLGECLASLCRRENNTDHLSSDLHVQHSLMRVAPAFAVAHLLATQQESGQRPPCTV